MNFPRTTDKVLRGLENVLQLADYDADWEAKAENLGFTAEQMDDTRSAFHWILQTINWRKQPKRKQAIPPQLAKVLKARYTR